MRPLEATAFITLAILLSLLLFFSIDKCEMPHLDPDPIRPLESQPTVPAVPDEPPFAVVDFEDMAGLDVATQELLNERYRDIGPADFEKRLRRLEWAVSALSDRVFGKSLLPGKGQVGELGSEGGSPATHK